MDEWAGRTAVEIASAVRAGKATAARVVAAHLEQTSAHNPEIGAFVRVRAAAAAAEAEAVDARPDRADLPLAGVPVSVKDTVPVSGEPMRTGSAATPAAPQDRDHPLVARLRGAGAVVTGLTNLPELAIYPFTDSAYGITRNPWNRSATAGGSSGGAAASVASGMVPIAHGSDGLGSLRIPAAACGLFSIKPGPDVVPGTGHWFGMSENGPIAATVADAALMLGVMAGTAFGLGDPGRLRIAMSVRAPSRGLGIAPDRAAAVRETGTLLAGLGHSVAGADPPYPGWLAPVLSSYWLAAPAADAGPRVADMEARTRRHVRAGRMVLRTRPPRSADRDGLRAALKSFFESHDVLLTPTLARPVPPALRYGTRSWRRSVAGALRFSPLTGVWNLAGYPAATVPVPAAGMPGSVQLVAPEGREDLLLNLAAQIERARPWPRHAPRYVVGGGGSVVPEG